MPIGRRGDLDRACFFRRKAYAFHQGNGESPGCDRVGNGRARDHARQHRRQDRGFCRPAPQRPQQGYGEFDEPSATACSVEKRSEQDKEEDHRGRDPKGHTKDALGLHPVMPHRLAEGGSTIVCDVARPFRIAPEKGEGEKAACNDHQRQAQRAVDRNHQNTQADRGHDDVGCAPQTGAVRDLETINDQVQAGRNAQKDQGPIIKRDAVPRRILEQREGQRGQHDGEGKVHKTRLGHDVGEDAHARGLCNNSRQLRGDVKLEQMTRGCKCR